MLKAFLPLLASALLLGGAAHAQAPAAEVQALTKRLNQLMHFPKSEDDGEATVTLADCGVKQTMRKYRSPDDHNSGNISVNSSKKGSSWAIKTDDKVQLELNLSLEWAEVGSVSYVPKKRDKDGSRYYDIVVKRHARADGKAASGIADTISLSLFTQDEQEVASLVKKLDTVRRQCSSQKG
ncbi:hypothetical protein Q3A66_06285 [Hymenobacter sp. BT770]|uniref:hypothetical protein n=1 Tax=Hymenobacter sp. BT770 TaxID=2886942 RepID=UPI001D10EAFD|nr:hypothetical protein [Hymenobacter sp. BT770]MCC3152597.1 hypothetical protein [Hymenobacter sp. BT770]MDO3414670.1 hypothetical protein [Hymenobacter sp. BT770]